jgi:hypothetical protein
MSDIGMSTPSLVAATTERRRAVLRAVVAIEAVPVMRAHALPVCAGHVRGWGIPACVNETLTVINRDLCWLEGEGYLLRPSRQHAEYVSTEAGQRWAR